MLSEVEVIFFSIWLSFILNGYMLYKIKKTIYEELQRVLNQ